MPLSRMPLSRRHLLHLAGLLPLAACTRQPWTPPLSSFPDIRFRSTAPLALTVSEVDIIQDYQSPLTLPNVEQLFPVPPAQMAANWARDRLQPTNSATGRVQFHIKRASVKETLLPLSPGLEGAFKTQDARRYDATLEVELILTDAQGNVRGRVGAFVNHTQGEVEDTTPDQRQWLWYAMVQAMGQLLDTRLSDGIMTHLGSFLR